MLINHLVVRMSYFDAANKAELAKYYQTAIL